MSHQLVNNGCSSLFMSWALAPWFKGFMINNNHKLVAWRHTGVSMDRHTHSSKKMIVCKDVYLGGYAPWFPSLLILTVDTWRFVFLCLDQASVKAHSMYAKLQSRGIKDRILLRQSQHVHTAAIQKRCFSHDPGKVNIKQSQLVHSTSMNGDM